MSANTDRLLDVSVQPRSSPVKAAIAFDLEMSVWEWRLVGDGLNGNLKTSKAALEALLLRNKSVAFSRKYKANVMARNGGSQWMQREWQHGMGKGGKLIHIAWLQIKTNQSITSGTTSSTCNILNLRLQVGYPTIHYTVSASTQKETRP